MIKLFKNMMDADTRLVGINKRNIQYVYPNNPRKYFPLANDKVLSKSILEKNDVPVPETYAVIEGLWEIDKKIKLLTDKEKFVVKPAGGSGGGGILILSKSEKDRWVTPSGEIFTKQKLSNHLASILYGVYSKSDNDKVIIEYCLTPHIFLKEIYDNGIPDFRIILLHNEPIMAMLRVPTEKSGGKANLHQGAMGIGIDMKTGTLNQGFYKNKHIDHHPDSGVVFFGKKIPDWKKIVDIAIKSSKLVPLNFLGIDIIPDMEKGPMVIEINARPGLQIQNINKTGLIQAK